MTNKFYNCYRLFDQLKPNEKQCAFGKRNCQFALALYRKTKKPRICVYVVINIFSVYLGIFQSLLFNMDLMQMLWLVMYKKNTNY